MPLSKRRTLGNAVLALSEPGREVPPASYVFHKG
jgi:hypothetical protein